MANIARIEPFKDLTRYDPKNGAPAAQRIAVK
jgi:hypothetical protein